MWVELCAAPLYHLALCVLLRHPDPQAAPFWQPVKLLPALLSHSCLALPDCQVLVPRALGAAADLKA